MVKGVAVFFCWLKLTLVIDTQLMNILNICRGYIELYLTNECMVSIKLITKSKLQMDTQHDFIYL